MGKQVVWMCHLFIEKISCKKHTSQHLGQVWFIQIFLEKGLGPTTLNCNKAYIYISNFGLYFQTRRNETDFAISMDSV